MRREGVAARLAAACAGAFVLAASIGAAHAGAPPAGPLIRVGLVVGADSVLRVASQGGLRFVDGQSGELLAELPGPAATGLVREGQMVEVAVRSGVRAFSIRVEPSGAAPLTLGGRPYRGTLEVVAGNGLTAVNELPLEDYLLGVVPIEIGPRGPAEAAAVAAQAVAARTYAVAHLRARETLGFDVYGTVEDQAYGGLAAEREESTRAVRATAGTILMYDGLPIRAMYHSTCGGRTAAVEDVLDREPAPYLRAVSDEAPDGTDYCSASPRYRWVEELTPADLNGRVQDEVNRIFATTSELTGDIVDLRVAERTPTGRVGALAIRGTRSEFVLERLDIRIALHDDAGRILGSTDFDLVVRPDHVIELHGRGFGHGSGMCQWGAIGRARAGQSWETILNTYYPGAELVEAY